MPRIRDLALVSVSIDLGAGRRGVDMGPSALRIAGLTEAIEALGYEVREMGTVHAGEPENVAGGDPQARFLEEILDVCERTYGLVREGLRDGLSPLVLGGDHSLAMGSVAATAAHFRESAGKPIGLIWLDAHTDMNTPETTPSGNIHGMSLSVLNGQGPDPLVRLAGGEPALQPEHVSVIGARDIDPSELPWVRESGIRVFTMSEIDERGMAACIDEAIERATWGTAGYYLSLDLDGIDPMVAPGVGTPVQGGLSFREAHLACEKVSRSGSLLGLEIVELNPVLDDGNRTARLAVGLTASALGKSIL